jgi:hypothetical protein
LVGYGYVCCYNSMHLGL